MGAIEKDKIMKSRSLFRVLCVGAAMLVPSGGLTALSVGTAGASSTILHVNTASTITLGSLGTMNLATHALNELASPTTTKYSLAGITYPIIGSSIMVADPIDKIKVVHIGPTISSASLSTITAVLSGTGFTHCKITTFPTLTFTLSSGKWKTTGNSLSGVAIKTAGGTCTKKTTLRSGLMTHTLSGSLTLVLN
jgi:hypothetical protein